MVERANTAWGDHGNGDGIRNRPCQHKVEPRLRAVAIHRRQQNLARSQCHNLFGIFDGIDSRRCPPAVRKNFPAVRLSWLRDLLRVDGNDNALSSKFLRGLFDERPAINRRSVDRNLVSAGF